MKLRTADVLIIGSGLAGLYAAKLLADQKRVVLITKGTIEQNNSILAQGGIAAAIDAADNWENHYSDTILAGGFHNNEAATKELVKNAPKIIKQLIELGVPFDKGPDNSLELGREGGHNKRRIVHAGGDATGREVVLSLINQVKQKITIYEEEMAHDLIVNNQRCYGAIARDKSGELIIYHAEQTILTSGGIGSLYSLTSNDQTISGDGIAMAYRAGAELADLEFIQFHPTMLVVEGKSPGLISEAVRGEGAILVNDLGEYFMAEVHPLKDLAPRDIVARQIFAEQQTGRRVYLDISNISGFAARFPTISKLCSDNGIALEKGLLPVAPGAHFIMGGVKTALTGETNIQDLYAIGEVACTGVHGANRLASNSLLEGMFFANNVATNILKKIVQEKKFLIPKVLNHPLNFPSINQLQEKMSSNVGIVRDEAGLHTAEKWLAEYLPTLTPNSYYNLTNEELSRYNMLLVGWLITTSALARTESRGGHYRSDYPTTDDNNWLKRSIVRRRESNEPNQTKAFTSAAV